MAAAAEGAVAEEALRAASGALCCASATALDNAHRCGQDPQDGASYLVSAAHHDGFTDLAATGVLVSTSGGEGSLLVPAGLLRQAAAGGATELELDWGGGRRTAAPTRTARCVAEWAAPPPRLGWPREARTGPQGPFHPQERLWPHWGAPPDAPPEPPLDSGLPPTAAWAALRVPLPAAAPEPLPAPPPAAPLERGEPLVALGWPYGAATRQLGVIAAPAEPVRSLCSSGLWELSITCLPGLDGGVLVRRADMHRPVALIAPPFLLPGGGRGAEQGRAVAVPIAPMLAAARGGPRAPALCVEPPAGPSPRLPLPAPPTGALLRRVLCVRCRSGRWGSGVHLGGGLVLTNAHVARPPPGSQEAPRCSAHPAAASGPADAASYELLEQGGGAVRAAAEFVSAGPWDIALLRAQGELSTEPTAFDPAPLRPLEPCAVVGHPDGPGRPGAEHGAVGAVVRAAERELLIATTARVRPGASGGALVAYAREGAPAVGLVTSCVWDGTLRRLVPELGLCIPTSALAPALAYAAGRLGAEGLRAAYSADDAVVDAAWQLAARAPGAQGADAAAALQRLHKEMAVLKGAEEDGTEHSLPPAPAAPQQDASSPGGALLAYVRGVRGSRL
eukprot:TRINITY_DN2925_c4_g1_i1.p1 TRINITY_DN2925_c4_g1~~TRINITY_DN2925_c4_g1_i1.p1  ORF type:complete len:640 (+),score=165.55 TRINITY_DN2925_c4_g1_i1:64-1920(+)